jgi:putative ABC transport system permease protein
VSTFAPKNVICVGFEPESFLELNRIEWIQGTPEKAIPRLRDGDAILVAEQFLTARGLGVGEEISLGPEGREKSFEIVGVVGAAGLDVATQIFGIRSLYMEHAVSCVFMDYEAVGTHFNSQEAYILQLVMEEDFGETDELALAEQVSTLAPGATFNSGRAIKRIVLQVGTTVLGVSSTVALGSLLLACFAVGNIVAAGISAKKYEYGVLRAIGGSRWLVARTIFGEVIVMGVLASIAGIVLGIYLADIGMSLHRDLAGDELRFKLPVPAMITGTIVVILLALLASTPPVLSLLRRSTRELISAGR